MEALNQSDDPILTLAINLTFSCTLRVGEMLGLTWDCVDITEESLEKGFCSVYINKELQRVTKDAVQALNSKDIISVFPEIRKTCRSVRVLKKPKTESSIRKVYLPQTVARMLVSHKEEQENRSIPADSASCDT